MWRVKFSGTLDIFQPLKRPGPLGYKLTGEPMADSITFQVTLPTLAPGHDVEQRELSVQLENPKGTAQSFTVDCTSDQATVDDARFVAAQDTFVHLSLVDIDDAGNRSEARTLDFTAADTVPPAQPGDLAAHITGEI